MTYEEYEKKVITRATELGSSANTKFLRELFDTNVSVEEAAQMIAFDSVRPEL